MWCTPKKKYQHPKGGKPSKGKGKGKGKPTSIQYPANIMCEYVDQGKECPKYGKPEGCEYMHPEDGFEKNRAKRDAQEEAMKQKQDGKLIPPPRPEWSFEQCKKAGVCFRWMNRCICLLKECPYKHQIPENTNEAGAPAQVFMFNRWTFGDRDPKVNFGKRRKHVALVNEFNTNKSLEGQSVIRHRSK